MDFKLLASLEAAINEVLDRHAEEGLWDGYIHHTLTKEMATAAAQVFDASMSGQAFADAERGK